MKDRLDDFIDRNRQSFDNKVPSERVWTSIESALGFKKNTAITALNLWRAAAVIFMAVSAYLLIEKSQLSAQKVALKEFSDVESFYISQISEKTELIRGFESEGLNGFTNDFRQLEAMYQVLKEEMKNRPSQKVKEALVLNLLVRIDLLNQQLHRLEKEQEPEREESTSSNA